ncbi:MAG: Transposase [Polaromonas sp.]|nr:Transposase [Polaromonas sp.]
MDCLRLERWLQEQPDLTLAELAERLQSEGGPAVSTPTLCRTLQRLGLRRKKRPYTPPSGTQRRYIRHAVNISKTLPGLPPHG